MWAKWNGVKRLAALLLLCVWEDDWELSNNGRVNAVRFLVCVHLYMSLLQVLSNAASPHKQVQQKCQILIYSKSVCDATQIAMYFWSVRACCYEISVNVYMRICVGWRGYDVKGDRSAVTAGIPGG